MPVKYAPMSPAFTTRTSPATSHAPWLSIASSQKTGSRPVQIAIPAIAAAPTNAPRIRRVDARPTIATPKPTTGPSIATPMARAGSVIFEAANPAKYIARAAMVASEVGHRVPQARTSVAASAAASGMSIAKATANTVPDRVPVRPSASSHTSRMSRPIRIGPVINRCRSMMILAAAVGGFRRSSSLQYRGTLPSISIDQRSMPPASDLASVNPCSRRNPTTWRLRMPW